MLSPCNNVLDANTWDNDRAHVAKPSFQRNQFGGGLGGPILKRKHLYFFGNYEGLRLGTPSSTLVNLPTALERSGDFSQTFNPNGTFRSNPLDRTHENAVSPGTPRALWAGVRVHFD